MAGERDFNPFEDREVENLEYDLIFSELESIQVRKEELLQRLEQLRREEVARIIGENIISR